MLDTEINKKFNLKRNTVEKMSISCVIFVYAYNMNFHVNRRFTVIQD